MAIHRALWQRAVSKNSLPGLPCPSCTPGKLKLIKDGLTVREPKYASDWREKNAEDWEQDFATERWAAEMRCDEADCREVVHMIGDVEVVQAEVDLPGGGAVMGYEDLLRIQAVYPSPALFRLSKSVPRPVRRELEVSFRMYWTDTAACVARLRTAVERLLDDQNVPTEKKTKKGKLMRMDLKERIDAFTTGAVHADQLQGLRVIGNLGTHGGDEVTGEDLFDAVDVLEFVLAGIYETKTINAKALKLQNKKAGL